MTKRPPISGAPALARLAGIAVVVGAIAIAFAWTAGWLSPNRLTPERVVDSLAPPSGAVPGYRRNHAKGICFTGTFESNGNGAAISSASVFQAGSYPVTGRLNLAGPDPGAPDATGRVRGLGLAIRTPDRQEWRTALITAPFFPAATVEDFYALQVASADKTDPDAMKKYAGAHPALRSFGVWAGSAPFAESWAEDRFNSLDSFIFTDAQGRDQPVRWSFVPVTALVAVPPEELKKRDPDFLFKDIVARVAQSPQKWNLVLTLANPGDPTADPSKAWPDGHRQVTAGTLAASRIEAEDGGPCRELNFDPTVLPKGMRTSDDPFPAARSAAYRVSYDRRTAEERSYPHAASGGQP